MYQRISSLIPQKILESFKRELDYMNIDVSEKRFVGFLVVYGFLLSLGLAVNGWLFFKINILNGFIFSYVLFFGGSYMWLSIASESRGRFVEGILPDALQLIASNIRSGLTTERSIFAAARPEFGPFEYELKRVGREILAGKEVHEALLTIPKRIKSTVLERTIWLVAKGVKSGGEMGELLTELSDDLREQNAIDQEVKANVSTYVVLIFFAATIGAPILYSISTFIVQILSTQMQSMPTISGSQLSGGGAGTAIITGLMAEKKAAISIDFVLFFTMVCLIVSCFFASLLIGIINTGKEKHGLKYLPIVIVIALALFFVVRATLTSWFGGILL